MYLQELFEIWIFIKSLHELCTQFELSYVSPYYFKYLVTVIEKVFNFVYIIM